MVKAELDHVGPSLQSAVGAEDEGVGVWSRRYNTQLGHVDHAMSRMYDIPLRQGETCPQYSIFEYYLDFAYIFIYS